MNYHPRDVEPCAAGGGLIDLDFAIEIAARQGIPITEAERVPLRKAVGRTLAEDVIAELALPRFDQAAMDGYALSLAGGMLAPGDRLGVAGRIAAGDQGPRLPAGNAARIFTGAPLPQGADSVLMQEHAWLDGSDLVVDRMVRPGENIRRRGEDIEAGDHLLTPGTRLDGRHVALLAAQGKSSVSVVRRPRVAVISTGNELAQPGQPLSEAAVYDSNRPMLLGFVEQAGLDGIDGGCVRDDPEALGEALLSLSRECDLVVTTGGASVGEEDHSARAVAISGGSFVTLRIALKPGKPAVVGRIGRTAYLGLPGNPVSALVSWLLLGRAICATLEGGSPRRPAGLPLRVTSEFRRRPGRREFVPGRLLPGGACPEVEILGKGGSARLRPLVEADGLVEIQPLHAPVERGALVSFHRFRDGFSA